MERLRTIIKCTVFTIFVMSGIFQVIPSLAAKGIDILGDRFQQKLYKYLKRS